MTTDPGYDQKRALLADLQRLKELITPHGSGPGAPIVDALSRMPAPEAAEARAILGRLGAIGEDPEKTAARQDTSLLRLAEYEGHIRGILSRPHYKIRGGQVVTDPATGEPVRDDAVERQARETLARLDQLRSRLTGLPAVGDGDGDGEAH